MTPYWGGREGHLHIRQKSGSLLWTSFLSPLHVFIRIRNQDRAPSAFHPRPLAKEQPNCSPSFVPNYINFERARALPVQKEGETPTWTAAAAESQIRQAGRFTAAATLTNCGREGRRGNMQRQQQQRPKSKPPLDHPKFTNKL